MILALQDCQEEGGALWRCSRMKKWLIVVGLISVVVLLAARYAHVRTHGIRLSPGEFVEMAGNRDSAGSMHLLEYDGARDGRAYLRTWQMHRLPKTIIYWTEIDALPTDVREQVVGGTGRWKTEGGTEVVR